MEHFLDGNVLWAADTNITLWTRWEIFQLQQQRDSSMLNQFTVVVLSKEGLLWKESLYFYLLKSKTLHLFLAQLNTYHCTALLDVMFLYYDGFYIELTSNKQLCYYKCTLQTHIHTHRVNSRSTFTNFSFIQNLWCQLNICLHYSVLKISYYLQYYNNLLAFTFSVAKRCVCICINVSQCVIAELVLAFLKWSWNII